MSAALRKRLDRLEAAQPQGVTHEESLAALDRLENAPADYTEAQRAADTRTLDTWEAAAEAAGLA